MADDTNDDISRRREEYRQRWHFCEGTIGKLKFQCNPVTTIAAATVLWSLLIWAFVDSDSKSNLIAAKRWITDQWTWLFVAQQVIWTLFVLIVYIKWRHIKLGNTNDIPEYGDYTYFAMIFCTGFSAAKFPSAVNGVIRHYNHDGNAWVHLGKFGPDEKAQNAINLSLFLWGFNGISIYCLPTVLISFLAYRKGLPVTMRTCLYPLIGTSIHGIIGDLVDTMTIVTILLGTTIGLRYGAQTIVAGVNAQIPDVEVNTRNEVIAIWFMIGIAVVSVLTGIGLGIKRLSQLGMSCGIAVLLMVFFCDHTSFLLNVFVQSIGYYFQNTIGLSLHTGAFTQKYNFPQQTEASKDWMHNNTVFYWAWWIAIAPLSSIFTARISRGRTIGDIVKFTFFLPALFLFAWFTTFGGLAINMQHDAMKANITCDMYNKQSERIQSLWNITTLPYPNIHKLDCRLPTSHLYDVLRKYNEIYNFLYVCVMFAIVLQFATQVDSTSYVTDGISSNGAEKGPAIQRVMWVVSLGASATVFAYSGSAEISSLAIIAAFPFLLLFNLSCYALWKVLTNEHKWMMFYSELDWSMRYGDINTGTRLKMALLATICPWYYMGNIAIKLEGRCKIYSRMLTYLQFAAPFYIWLILMISQVKAKDLDNIGWASFLGFVAYSVQYRKQIREASNITGNSVEDFLVLLVYPLAIAQMNEEFVNGELQRENQHVEDIRISNTGHVNNAFPRKEEQSQYFDDEDVYEPGGTDYCDINELDFIKRETSLQDFQRYNIHNTQLATENAQPTPTEVFPENGNVKSAIGDTSSSLDV